MNKVAILETKPLGVRNLLKFVLKSRLDENSDVQEIKRKVEEYLAKNIQKLNEEKKLELKREVQNFSFYDMANYELSLTEGSEREKLYKVMITVSNFKEKFISNLSNSESIDEPIKKLERKVSPSLEAYEYVGNNKLDIDSSERSYGLLFE